jgi:hypothetical protein
MNRWSKSGVLDRVFEQLQREQIVRIRIEAVSLDSTTVKVLLQAHGEAGSGQFCTDCSQAMPHTD